MLNNNENGKLEKRHEDAVLLNQLAAAYSHFGNDRSACHFLRLSIFILASNTDTLRMLAIVEYRLKRPRQAIEALLSFETLTAAPLDEELRQVKGRSLAMLGEAEAAKAVLSH